MMYLSLEKESIEGVNNMKGDLRSAITTVLIVFFVIMILLMASFVVSTLIIFNIIETHIAFKIIAFIDIISTSFLTGMFVLDIIKENKK